MGAKQMTRVYPDAEQKLWLAEGEYGKDLRDGVWYFRLPGAHTGSLAGHEVVEHEDGTISAFPSILLTYEKADGKVQWHGYLEHGQWRDV